jgi:hydroxylamine reductase (hybrid-cluster protein)
MITLEELLKIRAAAYEDIKAVVKVQQKEEFQGILGWLKANPLKAATTYDSSVAKMCESFGLQVTEEKHQIAGGFGAQCAVWLVRIPGETSDGQHLRVTYVGFT